MLVKEILALAAFEAGRTEVADDIVDEEPTMDDQIDLLLRSYNLVENEIAFDYFPLIARERVTPTKNGVLFMQLAHAPVDVHAVKDEWGKDVRFEILPTRLVLPEGTGEVEVTYAYAPENKGLDDEPSFSGRISGRLLALGTASEYCLVRGLYEEAAMFETRFRDALRAAGILRRKLSIPSRRWL